MGWKSAVPTLVVALVLTSLVSPASAQTYGFLRFGNAAYADDDPFCEDPSAFITTIAAGVSTPLFGVSAEFNNEDYPWPPPPPPNGANSAPFLTHGNSLQVMAELNPAQFIAQGISEFARPFIGVGLHISGDGEARPDAGAGPTYGVRGQTRPFVAYGVNGFLPISDRLGVTAGYRGTSVFFGDFELETPGGAIETVDGATLTSGSWALGLTLRFGT